MSFFPSRGQAKGFWTSLVAWTINMFLAEPSPFMDLSCCPTCARQGIRKGEWTLMFQAAGRTMPRTLLLFTLGGGDKVQFISISAQVALSQIVNPMLLAPKSWLCWKCVPLKKIFFKTGLIKFEWHLNAHIQTKLCTIWNFAAKVSENLWNGASLSPNIHPQPIHCLIKVEKNMLI